MRFLGWVEQVVGVLALGVVPQCRLSRHFGGGGGAAYRVPPA